jgi:hypothetical protein
VAASLGIAFEATLQIQHIETERLAGDEPADQGKR